MPDVIKFSADIQDIDERLDSYLACALEDFSRSRIQKLIKDGAVKVNNKEVKSSYSIKDSDEIEIIVPDASELKLDAEDIPLTIEYEDSDMLVINKPQGMLTHPTSVEKTGTLVNALLYYCKDSLSGINGVMRPGILHRLDRDTSGLLMVAKNDFAHKILAEQIKTKSAIRQYLAFCHGVFKNDTGTIDKPIGRHPIHRNKMGIVPGGKNAITHYRVLKRFEKYTFVELTLHTGRTHQIRVHLSDMHHPIAGDEVYGGGKINVNLGGQALHAYRLSFNLPSTDERKTIEIEPSCDIKRLLRIFGDGKDD
ncbi:MAG: RluA family pseudouridine synthase [Candidatus Gastranaerophilales bacterium]|nr:RluA family pseudouridine synthase [Candidatus Gastranaerophilales bacterium]